MKDELKSPAIEPLGGAPAHAVKAEQSARRAERPPINPVVILNMLLKPVILALSLKSDGQTSQGQSNRVGERLKAEC
jgi:hypothetical protein